MIRNIILYLNQELYINKQGALTRVMNIDTSNGYNEYTA